MPTTSDAIVLMTLAAGTTVAAVIDVRTRRVPNLVTIPLAAVGLAIAGAGLGRVGLGLSLAGCLVGLLLMMPGHLLGATGAGDVKLFAAAGTLLGPGATVTAFAAMAIAGGVMALAVAARRRRFRQTLDGTARLVARPAATAAEIENPTVNNRFAYAPAIAIGALLAALAQ